MASHVSLGPIHQPLKFQPTGVPVRNDVPNLPNNCGKHEDADEVGQYSEEELSVGSGGRGVANGCQSQCRPISGMLNGLYEN